MASHEPYIRSHTPTWTPPQDWLAYEDNGQPQAEFERPRHRRAQTATLLGGLQPPPTPQQLEYAVPPTTNLLAAADKSHLRRTTRKLERVLGEVPMMSEDEVEPWQAHGGGGDGLRRRGTHDGRATPTAITRATSSSAQRAGQRAGFSMDLPARATSPYPQLRIVPSHEPSTPVPLSSIPSASSSPHPHSSLSPDPLSPDDRSHRLSVSSNTSTSGTSDGITPPGSPDPEPSDKRRKQHQMAKLQRFLGESVPAELLLHPTQTNHSTASSHSSTASHSSVGSVGTGMSFGSVVSYAEAATPPRANSLKAKAKRRLSLELSALAGFNLTSRLANAGPPPPRGGSSATTPSPSSAGGSFSHQPAMARTGRSTTLPAVLAIQSSSSPMSTNPSSPTTPTSINTTLTRVGTNASISAATRRSIEKDLQLRPRPSRTTTIKEEIEEVDPMSLIYGSELPMPKIKVKMKKEKDEKKKEEKKVKTKTSSISGGFWGGRNSSEKASKMSLDVPSPSLGPGASNVTLVSQSSSTRDRDAGGLRGLMRKKSFDAWSASRRGSDVNLPLAMSPPQQPAVVATPPPQPQQPPKQGPTLPPLPPQPRDSPRKDLPMPPPTPPPHMRATSDSAAPLPQIRRSMSTSGRSASGESSGHRPSREEKRLFIPNAAPSAPAPAASAPAPRPSMERDDILSVRSGSSLQRSASQRTPEEERERRRSRRRKSRSMTGLPSAIGKLALGGYALELEPDPTWDAAQSDYEVTNQRRRHGRALITADQIDDSDDDLQWMFRRTRGPRRRPRALEDMSDSDLELDGADVASRREMTMAALAGLSPASTSDGHGNRRSPSYGRTRGHASSSSLGHSLHSLHMTPTKSKPSGRPSTADPSESPSSQGPPSFIDPFTSRQIPPVPPVPSTASSGTPPTLERSKSSPVLPPRSTKRPLPAAPSPQLPPQLSYQVSPLAEPQQPKSGTKFGRFFRSGSSATAPAPGGGKVLRKSDRERERSLERKMSQRDKLEPAPPASGANFRYVPAHPLPPPPVPAMPKEFGFVRGHRSSVSFSGSIVDSSTGHEPPQDYEIRIGGADTQVEIVDGEGRKNVAPVDDVMFALRQLRSM